MVMARLVHTKYPRVGTASCYAAMRGHGHGTCVALVRIQL